MAKKTQIAPAQPPPAEAALDLMGLSHHGRFTLDGVDAAVCQSLIDWLGAGVAILVAQPLAVRCAFADWLESKYARSYEMLRHAGIHNTDEPPDAYRLGQDRYWRSLVAIVRQVCYVLRAELETRDRRLPR